MSKTIEDQLPMITEDDLMRTCPCKSCQQVRSRAKELEVPLDQMCDRCGYYARLEGCGELCNGCYELMENYAKRSAHDYAATTLEPS